MIHVKALPTRSAMQRATGGIPRFAVLVEPSPAGLGFATTHGGRWRVGVGIKQGSELEHAMEGQSMCYAWEAEQTY